MPIFPYCREEHGIYAAFFFKPVSGVRGVVGLMSYDMGMRILLTSMWVIIYFMYTAHILLCSFDPPDNTAGSF